MIIASLDFLIASVLLYSAYRIARNTAGSYGLFLSALTVCMAFYFLISAIGAATPAQKIQSPMPDVSDRSKMSGSI
jgi:adenine-specific DNA methylase